MRVRTRLVLFGAVLPTVGTALAVAIAGQLFRHQLIGALDETLLGQAAVQSVSLFDRPGGDPHLHLRESPVVASGRFTPTGAVALYEPDGSPAVRYPADATIPPSLKAGPAGTALGPRTVRDAAGVKVRELVLSVARGPDTWALWVAAPLQPIDAAVGTFFSATLSAVGALAALLFAVQLWQARRLARRVMVMSAHLPRLREGDFGAVLPPDPTGDELAELRAALAEATHQLDEARARQDRLIANAAHELRTPLGLMRTEIDLALRKTRTAEELRTALEETRHEVDRLAGLAAQLLALASLRQVTLDRQRADLARLVRDAADGHRAEAEERGLQLAVRAPEHAEAVLSPTRVRQALDNLLSNAIRFAPRGSAVTVELDGGGPGWRLAVADDGPGVAAADRGRIFEPFYRGTDGGGTGLGLAIVQEVAREHGGRAFLDEARAAGARFVVELPTG